MTRILARRVRAFATFHHRWSKPSHKAVSSSPFLRESGAIDGTNRGNSHTTNNNNNNNIHSNGFRSYSLAIAREVPASFPDALTMSGGNNSGTTTAIDYRKATEEHDAYLRALRQHVPVLCLPALDDLPDSVFVEDTVVAVGNRAVVTRPGHPSRRPEVDTIRRLLRDQLGMDVTDMNAAASVNEREYERERETYGDTDTTGAICDGGDVLYTGRHLFVGINGQRTNDAALAILEEGLGLEAIPIRFSQGPGALHLKSVLTHLDDRSLVVPKTDLGRRVFQQLSEASGGAYSWSDAVWLPAHAGLSCNVVSLGSDAGTGILAQLSRRDASRDGRSSNSSNSNSSETRSRLEDAASERERPLTFVSQEEAAKCDGALTCCSVLLDL
eukprot:jgi/Psemu1/196397/e_gw1.186.40.1